MEECLNPYYTGIHLALMQMAETAVVAVAVCLNPYYTGIHLASLAGKEVAEAQCLNPYYTGIHLASSQQTAPVAAI